MKTLINTLQTYGRQTCLQHINYKVVKFTQAHMLSKFLASCSNYFINQSFCFKTQATLKLQCQQSQCWCFSNTQCNRVLNFRIFGTFVCISQIISHVVLLLLPQLNFISAHAVSTHFQNAMDIYSFHVTLQFCFIVVYPSNHKRQVYIFLPLT